MNKRYLYVKSYASKNYAISKHPLLFVPTGKASFFPFLIGLTFFL